VRDLRIRWALEEASLPYRVETTPFEGRKDGHNTPQPFGHVPWLTDGDLAIFESGAILLHLGEMSEALMSRDARERTEVTEWVFAALNSVEMASLPWSIFHFSSQTDTPMFPFLEDFLTIHRLARIEPLLPEREWLAGTLGSRHRDGRRAAPGGPV